MSDTDGGTGRAHDDWMGGSSLAAVDVSFLDDLELHDMAEASADADTGSGIAALRSAVLAELAARAAGKQTSHRLRRMVPIAEKPASP